MPDIPIIGDKACPFLPAIPEMDPRDPTRIKGFTPSGCMKINCQLWDSVESDCSIPVVAKLLRQSQKAKEGA